MFLGYLATSEHNVFITNEEGAVYSSIFCLKIIPFYIKFFSFIIIETT